MNTTTTKRLAETLYNLHAVNEKYLEAAKIKDVELQVTEILFGYHLKGEGVDMTATNCSDVYDFELFDATFRGKGSRKVDKELVRMAIVKFKKDKKRQSNLTSRS